MKRASNMRAHRVRAIGAIMFVLISATTLAGCNAQRFCSNPLDIECYKNNNSPF